MSAVQGGRPGGPRNTAPAKQFMCQFRLDGQDRRSLLRCLRIRHGINAEFLADMGELFRVGEPAVRHHRAQLGEPRLGKEQPRRASARIEAHQPPFQKPLGNRRDLRFAGFRAAAPGLEVKAFGHGRKRREEPVEFVADIGPLARCEPGDRRGLELAHASLIIPRLRGNPKKPLANQFRRDSSPCMIRAGFLDPESRRDLIDLGRDGSVAHRLARRANALVLLDDGMSCGDVAKVLLLDDDTVRTWYRLYEDEGIEGLASFGYDGSTCRLSDAQQDKLRTWIAETLPRTTREVGVWIETECGITYESRSGLIALLHRLEMEHRKPKAVSSKLDPDKQAGTCQRL